MKPSEAVRAKYFKWVEEKEPAPHYLLNEIIRYLEELEKEDEKLDPLLESQFIHNNEKNRMECKCAVSGWVSYDWNKIETRPTKYGKYFVHRKDGKTHWETWNGSGWAYNGNVITFWMELLPPCH